MTLQSKHVSAARWRGAADTTRTWYPWAGRVLAARLLQHVLRYVQAEDLSMAGSQSAAR